ncbi:3-oxoacid CoA-transferase [Actinomadura syzygii]|uniref:3-oxoacid CoA-transferase subunit A n=1 Tax=Actinomadura syzygii TaxID=1427538 RepID=A0A5D0U443_9ACTN|nr:3-oxoacid CoA-transferase subunit A [Actinomadura syzygii]TYC13178.1 3-oxoacid CoA-transferase subunit A [Actinomadura syzygii]
MTVDKVYASAADAVADIPAGARLGVGGFGHSRTYQALIPALFDRGVKDLRVVVNSLGGNPNSVWTLLEAHRISHITVSISQGADEYIRSGEVGIELVPQGTLVERLRAAGAGIAGFYTRTGYGTKVAAGKDVRWFDGEAYIFERALPLDFAFIRAHRADRYGNVSFRGVGRNLNPSMAKAAGVVIVEATEVVDALEPEQVDLPGVFVHRVVQRAPEIVPFPAKRRGGADIDKAAVYNGKPGWTRRRMAQVCAEIIPDSSYVNLGLGIPTLVSNFTAGRGIVTQAENGILGMGEDATADDYDQDVYNAASFYVHLGDGASFFDTLTSFEMIRGGKLDYTVLGGLQVDAEGNLANWATANRAGGTIGGAMDLAAGDATLIVTMPHLTNDGGQKLVSRCSFPLTGVACVDVVVTDLCVLRREAGRFRLERVAPGFEAAEIAELTELAFDH